MDRTPPKKLPTALPGRTCARSNKLVALCTKGHECLRMTVSDQRGNKNSQISKCVQSRRPTGYRPAKQTFAMLGQKCAEHNAYFKQLKCEPGLECRQKSVLKNGRNYTNSSAASYCQKKERPTGYVPANNRITFAMLGQKCLGTRGENFISLKCAPGLECMQKTEKKHGRIYTNSSAASYCQEKERPTGYVPAKENFTFAMLGQKCLGTRGENFKTLKCAPGLECMQKTEKKNGRIYTNSGAASYCQEKERPTGYIPSDQALWAKKGDVCSKPTKTISGNPVGPVMRPRRCEHGYVCRQKDEDELMNLPTPSYCLKAKRRATGLKMVDKDIDLPELKMDVDPLLEV